MDEMQQIWAKKEDHTFIKVEAARRNMKMWEVVALMIDVFKSLGNKAEVKPLEKEQENE